ncbi:AKAP7 2'5' RNA ligase-like domain-containing protein [Clostridium sp. SYSU_GA19001]|uniref:2'-5' RNA ligase family protein n=1 Tax=Clostridium caldaquaticum TaxID=2940653 RepID=UPI002076E136|nr:AKAP7 2'5' RNA ligase-like domain-containing protein [Clostridium caldaquaticum]MCM8709633.1 AKAP7 2'5' RNA ligase-like domain-containing protein [Clostridium caldaquaticum]
MKYYLVALFDTESYAAIETIQKNICRKYKIYKNVPMLHIPLETIEDPDIDKLSKILTDMLKPYKKFKVETNGIICFDPPYKSVNLKIETKGYIARLARTINDTLKLHGFNVKDNINNWDLHVSLANTNYAVKDWSAKEYAAACSCAKKDGFYRLAKIEKIELWKSVNNRKELLVKSFPLRDF